MKNLTLLFLLFGILFYSACINDDNLMISAPCQWQAEFLSVPDTCFDLPRSQTGSVFTAPYEVDYSFFAPTFNPLEEGSIYYVKINLPERDEIQLIRRDLCPGSMNTEQIIATEGFGFMKINQDGNLLYRSNQRTLNYYNVSNNTVDTILTDISMIDAFWINGATCAACVYIEETGKNQYVTYDTSGVRLDTLPITFANISNQNDMYFAWYYSSGPLLIYSTATLELVKSIPRPDDFNGAIRTTWVDNERLLLLETKRLSLLNIETEEETLLLDYSGCENIGFYSVTSDPFDHDRIMISRFDHYYDVDGQIFQHERISYYNIETGEEQILELE